jgi:hypothetical protein
MTFGTTNRERFTGLAISSNLWQGREVQGTDHSIPARILAAILPIVVVVPVIWLMLATEAPSPMTGGCHHNRLPVPSHSCCYPRTQQPAQVQALSHAIPLNLVSRYLDAVDPRCPGATPLVPVEADASPPHLLILRI